MNKLDVQKEYKNYYTAREQPEIVEFTEARYVSILGKGRPGTDVFYEKKRAVIAILDELQKIYIETEKAFTSAVVEIFYWYDEKIGFVDIGNFYTTVDLDLLHYRIAVRIPNFITEEDIKSVAAQRPDASFSDDFELFTYTAGKCVQLLHLGPLAGELETLPVLQQFATEKGLRRSGMHHEIHLTPFERGQSQAHLQTILRDPVTELIN